MTYYILKGKELITEKELVDGFWQFPDEIRWGEYCGSPEEYIYQGIISGNLIELKKGKLFASDKLMTPSEYGKHIGISISDDISLEDFERAIAKVDSLWTYPISEYTYVADPENRCGSKVVAVAFSAEGTQRFVEVPEMMDKEEENNEN